MDHRDFFVKLLDWVGHSPWRLIILVIMSLMAMVGWFVYTEKDAFMASYRAQQSLPHMNGKYEEASDFIMKRSNADLVAIFDVNPLLNTRKIVYFSLGTEGRVSKFDGHDVGLFTKNLSNNQDVIRLMSGEIPCAEYKSPQSYIGFVYVEKGVKFMCRISIPPDPSKFIGQISVGWKEIPKDVDLQKTVIRVAAEMLWAN